MNDKNNNFKKIIIFLKLLILLKIVTNIKYANITTFNKLIFSVFMLVIQKMNSTISPDAYKLT